MRQRILKWWVGLPAVSLTGRAKQGLTCSLMAFHSRCLSSKRACSIPVTLCVIHHRGQQHCLGTFTSPQPGALPGDPGAESGKGWVLPTGKAEVEVTVQQPGRGGGGVLPRGTAGAAETPVLPLQWQNRRKHWNLPLPWWFSLQAFAIYVKEISGFLMWMANPSPQAACSVCHIFCKLKASFAELSFTFLLRMKAALLSEDWVVGVYQVIEKITLHVV